MAKQTFSTGQILTAAQMTSLQQTAMLGGAASAKTASYTLVAADAGTAISMTSASATTITVNTALFAAGDTVQITNLGAGVCTITAGTATVNTSATLALAQYESGTLDFTSTSAAIFIKGAGAAAGAASGPAFRAYRNASQQSTTEDTYTKIQFNAEDFDTDNCFDSTTNYRFTPNKSGYYQFNCTLRGDTNEDMLVGLYKNGSLIANLSAFTLNAVRASGGSDIAYANGTTDYFEIFAYLSSDTTRNIKDGSGTTFFSGVWIRS